MCYFEIDVEIDVEIDGNHRVPLAARECRDKWGAVPRDNRDLLLLWR